MRAGGGENEIIGIIGNNGVGKTTLIKSCLDILTYEGEILYLDRNLRKMNKAEKVKTYSALLEGNRNLYWKLTPIENINYFAALKGVKYSHISEMAEYLLMELNLFEQRNQLVENLSRGMQQKVAFIITIVLNTPVIFLDEPTLGVDVESKKSMIDFLLKSGYFQKKLVIVTSHDLHFIQTIATSVFKLKNGLLDVMSNLSGPDQHYIFKVLGDEKVILDMLPAKLKKTGMFYEFEIDLREIELSVTMQLLIDSKVDIVSIENVKFNMEHFYCN
ncbi:ABC transporter ATP-binding protein [Culturomica sp.]|uniref:ATP-binding cassette domain-containing protein n=1 Tax=Culturomica sp. TaxID=1926652 RepID=UPI000E9CE31D|nr:ABC transporter ATP-binding protein [Culturomica sp.]HBO27621.1 ABC transporter ATP-binding protein [Culturomica sp.]